MSIERVTERWGETPYMRAEQAAWLRDFLPEHELRSLLELGFYHGKSSAYLAAILEERGGEGHLTTIDLVSAKNLDPCIEDLLEDLGLSHRVTPIYCEQSFTLDLRDMLAQPEPPQFDFCYIDGGHTWDVTGFAFLLVDLLMKPGGWVLFDDLDWTLAKHQRRTGQKDYATNWPEKERHMAQVRQVWDILVPARGYEDRQELTDQRWALARKPG
jgi:predicted O-methyltransferase YrrM